MFISLVNYMYYVYLDLYQAEESVVEAEVGIEEGILDRFDTAFICV